MKEQYAHLVKLNQDRLKQAKLRLRKLKAYEKTPGREEYVQQAVNRMKLVIKAYKGNLEFMRIPKDPSDDIYRQKIRKDYAKTIAQTIPDGYPIVFHGNSNISKVREIIKSGGLKTPEQMGVGFQSFATQIDVTYKNDIHVSLDFAEPGDYTLMPYGAIFAFTPKESEIGNVISTRGTEVSGGVDGVDFREQPERLKGIITTPENVDVIKSWCKESGIDANKVFTHEEFLVEIQKTLDVARPADQRTESKPKTVQRQKVVDAAASSRVSIKSSISKSSSTKATIQPDFLTESARKIEQSVSKLNKTSRGIVSTKVNFTQRPR